MSIDVMKQALDAFEDPWKAGPEGVAEAIIALRQAIEQAQQPNGWALREVLFDEGIAIGHREPQHKPLTDEEIEKLRHMIDWTADWSYNTFARAIEASHGIKGEA